MIHSPSESDEVFPEDVPVIMPELPTKLVVTTAQQFKALGDPTRGRILRVIQHQPATAKQISEKLHIPPGTIGHHLQVLEAAGLAQVIARRLVHGIIAKYYTRTARLFIFDFPAEVKSETSLNLDIMTEARDELTEALIAGYDFPLSHSGFPHARLSQERADFYRKRLFELISELASEPIDPEGQVYGLFSVFFLSPPYLQSDNSTSKGAPYDG